MGSTPWDMVGGGIGGAFQYAGAKKQADAMEQASKEQAASAKYAADQADAANKRAEVFQRQQAQYTGQQGEIDRRANYDQTAARMRRLGSIGNLLGLHVDTSMPAYVPGVVPNFLEDAPTGPTPYAMVNGQLVPVPSGKAPSAPLQVGSGQTPAAAMRMPSVGMAVNGSPAGAPPPVPSPQDLAAIRARMGSNTGFVTPRRPGSVGSYLGA